ncbi:prepilin peptidase [Caulobacter sp. 17J65-9]|uniref:A24 family peptidase n=1 Tax=Caulobacter sp. 17J65-9 TaxID=2709382 RepID=UPI0013CC0D0D|nr:prepilin peptidase [Caulobacter sp. 17J65-9]NEX94688.1 pilus assembly protein CpaA [Caulobacter sp. 17J65-9]
MNLVTAVLLCVFPVVAIAAALRDVTTMTIPNWMSVVLIGGFFPTALAAGLAPVEMLSHLAIGLGVLLAAMTMFALRWIGGGDAKLLASASLWLGFSALPEFLIWTALAGGAFALILIQARFVAHAYAVQGQGWMGRLLQPKGDIPYGVAIAIGALAAYPVSDLVTSWSASF